MKVSRLKNRLACVIHGVLGVTPFGMAASLSVDDGVVTQSDDGRCGLTEAIQNANTDTQLFSSAGECPPGEGTDEIQLPIDGAFTVNETIPTIVSAIQFNGANSVITIDSGTLSVDDGGQLDMEELSLIFPVTKQGDTGINILLEGALTASKVALTRTGGVLGGDSTARIWNEGSLTINDSTLTSFRLSNAGTLTFADSILRSYRDSFATPLLNTESGDASISRSSIYGNFIVYGFSGGISNLGSMVISESTISNNYGELSGGIRNIGDLTITGSSLSGNRSGFFGGAIMNLSKAQLSITNSTISGNTAGNLGGGIYNVEGASIEIRNSTIAENRVRYGSAAGFQNNGIAYVSNTLIANNLRRTSYQQYGPGLDCANEGTFTTNRANWIADDSCSPTFKGNPKLGPLVNNGGPTDSHALRADSQAIDAGNNEDCPQTDQRGLERLDGACDIGSFEFYDLIASIGFELDGQDRSTRSPIFSCIS